MHCQASALLLAWYDQCKRELPWRESRNPYRIWISEIMLQQTRVETVKEYYKRFLTLFPTVDALANAAEEDVLKAWEGLGYYSRARNLQKAARAIVHELSGLFPNTYEQLLRLPGVGPYTAGAIASIAFYERVPAIDGNVYRVASRFYGIREDVGSPEAQKKIRSLILEDIPQERAGDHNQALMELGATLCSPAAPACDLCPWQALCDACAQGDAQLLPIHEKKRPPKALEVAVCLLTYGGRVLVMRRAQRMLRGLFAFALIENEIRPERLADDLNDLGLPCLFIGEMGAARHVFTHRIWEMQIFHFMLRHEPDPKRLESLDARLVNKDELKALPMPTALKVAREGAMALLQSSSR